MSVPGTESRASADALNWETIAPAHPSFLCLYSPKALSLGPSLFNLTRVTGAGRMTEPKAESKGARGKVEGEPAAVCCWGGQEAMNSSVERKERRPGRRQRDVLRGRERKTGRKQSFSDQES